MAKNKNRKHAPQTQQSANKSNEAEAAVKAPAAEAEPAAAAAEEITEQKRSRKFSIHLIILKRARSCD